MLSVYTYTYKDCITYIVYTYTTHPPTAYGRNVPCRAEQPLREHTLDAGRNSVTYEARLLKSLFLRLT